MILIDNSKSKISILRKLLDKKFILISTLWSWNWKWKKYWLRNYKKFKNIDILINNAGFVGNNKLEGWNSVFENSLLKPGEVNKANLTSPFHLTQSLKNVRKFKNSLINISSLWWTRSQVALIWSTIWESAAYAASKWIGSAYVGTVTLTI